MTLYIPSGLVKCNIYRLSCHGKCERLESSRKCVEELNHSFRTTSSVFVIQEYRYFGVREMIQFYTYICQVNGLHSNKVEFDKKGSHLHYDKLKFKSPLKKVFHMFGIWHLKIC